MLSASKQTIHGCEGTFTNLILLLFCHVLQDLGSAVAVQLTQAHAGRVNEQPQQQHAASATIGVLKLTPEKGCSIVYELAQQLQGRYNFLLVAGDEQVVALFRDMPHVRVSVAGWLTCTVLAIWYDTHPH